MIHYHMKTSNAIGNCVQALLRKQIVIDPQCATGSIILSVLLLFDGAN